ncbi:MAG TPA: helix-turn-helix transcriptional regulator [Ktedonobacteraceae bacterium]|nr:helix-turn-helix transcriptional regulator [Ktedonobacteraceae bacterium]
MEKTARIRLVEERKSRGWSQQELADALGTTQHNVSRWEAGLTTPGPYFRTKLCELFGMPIQELFLPKRNAHLSGVREDGVVTPLFLDLKQHARQAALTGEWSGTVRDEGQGLTYHVVLWFQPVGRTLRGAGHLHDASQGGDRLIQSVAVKGELAPFS